jgi:hypothetical protein
MRTKDRILVALSSFFWAVVGLFFTGSFLFFLIPLAGIIYAVLGGRKHV